jgi:hypothetical protein
VCQEIDALRPEFLAVFDETFPGRPEVFSERAKLSSAKLPESPLFQFPFVPA